MNTKDEQVEGQAPEEGLARLEEQPETPETDRRSVVRGPEEGTHTPVEQVQAGVSIPPVDSEYEDDKFESENLNRNADVLQPVGISFAEFEERGLEYAN